MKIAIDARSLKREGVGRYTRELIGNLCALDRKNSYVVFVEPGEEASLSLGEGARVVTTAPQTRLSGALRFISDLKREAPDILHSLDHWYVPVKAPCPVVSTFHDLLVKTCPGALSAKSRAYSRLATRVAIRRSSRIITVSEFNRGEIMKYYGLPEDRIAVIYNGVSEKFRVLRQDPPGFRKRTGLAPGYFLYVGSMRRYKNLKALLRAYAMLKPDLKERHGLVLIGGHAHEYPELKRLASSLGVVRNVSFPGFVGGDELVGYYSHALAFVTLSLYESFCLPVAEAMACGVPVITPNNLAFPEITGGAAVLVDPAHGEEVSRAMERVSRDPGLRERMVKRGLEAAARYSWAENAREVLALYESMGR